MRIILNKKRISNIIRLNELNRLTKPVSACYNDYMMMRKEMSKNFFQMRIILNNFSSQLNYEICEVSI